MNKQAFLLHCLCYPSMSLAPWGLAGACLECTVLSKRNLGRFCVCLKDPQTQRLAFALLSQPSPNISFFSTKLLGSCVSLGACHFRLSHSPFSSGLLLTLTWFLCLQSQQCSEVNVTLLTHYIRSPAPSKAFLMVLSMTV